MLAGMDTFVRLVGFGATVIPREPYRIDRAEDAPETRLLVAQGDRSEVVDVRGVLGGETSTDVVEILPGPRHEQWRIRTSVCGVVWPRGFGLASDPDGLSPFLLVGPRETMLWIAGPVPMEKAAPIERLATEDQTVRAVAEAEGASRIDLDYDVDGEPWWQRRYVVEWGDGQALVLTGQARAEQEERTRRAVDTLDETLEPAPAAAAPS